MGRWTMGAGAAAFAIACGDGGGAAGRDTGAPPKDAPIDVHINEVLASNATGLQDETGAFADWIELYNAGTKEVDLSGFWLTDDLGDKLKWQFPDGSVIAGGGHLIVFADGDTADGPLHANFSLDRLGESVGLYGLSSQDNPLIDSVEDFGPQATDQSLARFPDGASNWQLDPTPTPGEANGDAP